MKKVYLEFNDVGDIANYFFDLVNKTEYPPFRHIPKKEDYKTNTEWGMALDQYEKDKIKDKEIKNEYSEKIAELNNQFKEHLLFHLGLLKHNKANKLWEMAWDKGHSSGYSEVASEAIRLSELLEVDK